MAVINATTIYVSSIQGNATQANVNVSNGTYISNITLVANSTYMSVRGSDGSNLVSIQPPAAVGGSSRLHVGNSYSNIVVSVSATLLAPSVRMDSIRINGFTTNAYNITTDTGGGLLLTQAAAGFSNVVSYNVFTSNSTWTKPYQAGADDLVHIMMWGGGGGAWSNSTVSRGAGGGAFQMLTLKASQCNAVCNVQVGLGGAGNTTATGSGGTGGTSRFWQNSTVSFSVYGGGGASNSGFGCGGGLFSAGNNTNGGGPRGGNSTFGNSLFGGSRGGLSYTYYGGGGGVASSGNGGLSVYGGGGGGVVSGNSTFGGRGGNSTSIAGVIPGGGGYSNSTAAGAGARGEVRIWVTKVK